MADDVFAVDAEMTSESKEMMVLQVKQILAEMNFMIGPGNFVLDHVESVHLLQQAAVAAVEYNAADAVAFPLPIGLHRLVVNL